MRVAYLAAGAAGMYCGSCMHDNRLAAALQRQGRDVVLVPLYTPLRTDELDVSTRRIYYGGLNVYLQHQSALFRAAPRFIDRMLDARFLLNAVGRFAGNTPPEQLGTLTLSMLRGECGTQRKELDKLVVGLERLRPGLIHLPNLLFLGVARRLRETLSVPIVCGMTGEDVFVDEIPEPYRSSIHSEIESRAKDVDAFVALTDYYARHAVAHFRLPAERVHTVPMGIQVDDFIRRSEQTSEVFTIGFLAHVCRAKGLHLLCEAFARLRADGHAARLRVGGYLGAADREYLAAAETLLRERGVRDDFEYVGELTREGKVGFLHALDVLSVPTQYVESKGFYVLEALAAGVPVVQPEHGSFPELINATEGGLLFPPGDSAVLAEALARLASDRALRTRLGAQGQTAVRANHTADRMARDVWRLYEDVVARSELTDGPTKADVDSSLRSE